MKTLLVFFLCASLAANVGLLLRRAPPHADSGGMPAAATGSSSARAVVKAAPVLPLAALTSTDPAALCEALRAAGADEPTVRAVLDGVLRRRLRERQAALRIERARTAWWRAGRSADAGDAKLAKEMLTEPSQRLLGRDPLDLVDAESRYAFLPLEKRRRLAQIDLDYAELQARVPQGVMNVQLQAEAREQKLLADERRKDVLAALTPEERAEYDLRFSDTAGLVSRRAATMLATEPEFRQLKPLLDDFDQKSRALPKGDEFVAAYAELQRATVEQLVATLGHERARDFIWSGYDSEFSALRRAAEAAQLPAATPALVMELAVETGREAARVHDDPALTPEQKRAALLTVQQTARARLDVILPPAAQQKLPADGLRWLNELGDGRYRTPLPSLLSSGGWAVFTITAPPPAKRMEPAVIPPRAPSPSPPGK